MTTWYPDTCGCSITLDLPSPDFDWAKIDATHIASVTPCARHVGAAPLDTFNQVCHNENRVKNMLLGYVQQNLTSLQAASTSAGVASAATSDIATSAVSSDNSVTVADSAACPYCSSYGVPGALTFDVGQAVQYQNSGLDTAALQSWADSTFGAGKVVVS